MKTVGIYVHIPFCLAKCHYCDFVSYTGKSEAEKDAYLTALLKEGETYQRLLAGITGKSLYIGGGTPTCLTGGQFVTLFSALHNLFKLPRDIEITVEGNPGTLNKEKLLSLQKVGCNRLSLGVQSFSPHELQLLGRIHSVQDVYNTYELARQVGFKNISIDLMYGLPGQTIKEWRVNLEKATAMKPEHISLYQLNIEKGTPYAMLVEKGLLERFDQDEAFIMYNEAINYLAAKGYHQYEISNFAFPGKEAVHNSLYWRNEEYLGLGAGACGYLQGVRYTNETNLELYQKIVLTQDQLPVAEKELIDQELAMAESMFLGLRLLQGVNKSEFLKRHGVSIENRFADVLKKLKKQGLLQETPTFVALTKKGIFVANNVFQEFL
ncbi:MAG: radical SAM family heme chaperone HemW [Clostridia bacterium]|jgi:oxygen-independent coproporphyrinogen-3 oxidase|nr:radical SAM family heme chaperone HemW [Clostridia bacterium]